MKKLILAMILLFPMVAFASHSVTIEEVILDGPPAEGIGCGTQTVVINGSATYYPPFGYVCLTYWVKPNEFGSPYFGPADGYANFYRDCSAPNPWTYNRVFEPGIWTFRVEVSDSHGTSSIKDNETFEIAEWSDPRCQ